jgi:hypothetical protein
MGAITNKNIITDLEDLSIYSFDKCLKGNLLYLIDGYNKEPLEASEEINKAWEKLYNDYCGITKNNAAINVYLLACEINSIQNKITIVSILLNQALKHLDKSDLKEIIKEILNWGYVIDSSKDIESEVKKVVDVLNNTRTKLLRKEKEYEELTKGAEKQISLIEQKVKLHNILKIDINTKETSVLEWLAYWKEVESISKQKK